jgi:terminal uridylyltransferase
MAQTTIATATTASYVQTPNQRRHASKHRFFVVELSQALYDFVIQLLPTAEEMALKEDVRKLLERLIRTIEPDSRLLSFGSTANGFSLRNSGLLRRSLLVSPLLIHHGRYGSLLSHRFRRAPLGFRPCHHAW